MKRVLCLALAAGLAQGSGPGRQQAVERGLRFIYSTARDPKNFAEFGSDYLWCFYSVGAASRDPAVSRMAFEMGRERATVWIRDEATAPVRSADDLADLAYGAYAAERLGFPDPKLRALVREIAPRFSVRDYLWFDPAHEAPPGDVPEECGKCSRQNPRGATVCQRCGAPLTMRSRYDVWYGALINTYFGDRYGVALGAPYREVIRWLPAMRPYRGPESGANTEFLDTVYAVTHVVYTLDDYSQHPLSLPDEFQFLKTNFREAIATRDGEALGEFMDSLKALGLKDRDRLMKSGIDYLLATQNPDGSWGNPKAKDIYLRYHPTWTAIGGLMRYKWEHR